MISKSKALGGLLLISLFGLSAALSSALLSPIQQHAQRGESRKQSDRFPDIVLYTQHSKRVRFYDDLVKDKTVIINFIYSGCSDNCLANSAQLAKLNDLLGRRMGREILMLSISIDPVADSPERLKQYWEWFGAKPGWVFLTGKANEIDALRRDLGAYDLDPQIDADPAQHAGFITVGNDSTDRWAALPLLMDRTQLVRTILRILHDG